MLQRLARTIIRIPHFKTSIKIIAPFCQQNHSHHHDHDHSHQDFQPQKKASPGFTQEQIKAKHDEIDKTVKGNKIVLFMKGTPAAPMCGYSNYAVQILSFYKVQSYHSVDVLADPLLREELKNYSNWPTFPQLFVNSELVGGCDILMEMHKEGSLKELFAKAQ